MIDLSDFRRAYEREHATTRKVLQHALRPHELWFMLLDQIHHRCQHSVYLRMAGAKVPSIYGPSADEPWT